MIIVKILGEMRRCAASCKRPAADPHRALTAGRAAVRSPSEGEARR